MSTTPSEPMLRIYFECDNSDWEIPAKIIASSRAKHYAERDFDCGDVPNFHDAYLQEYEYSINDTEELLDWAANNMNWENIRYEAILRNTQKDRPDYAEEWPNARMDIVEMTIEHSSRFKQRHKELIKIMSQIKIDKLNTVAVVLKSKPPYCRHRFILGKNITKTDRD